MRTLILSMAVLALSFSFSSCISTPGPVQRQGGAPSATTTGKTKPYSLTTCLVSGEDLDSMGGRITKVYKGQEVQFCCKSCVKDFEADPDRFLTRLSGSGT